MEATFIGVATAPEELVMPEPEKDLNLIRERRFAIALAIAQDRLEKIRPNIAGIKAKIKKEDCPEDKKRLYEYLLRGLERIEREKEWADEYSGI